nr:hypothetical protein [uncultured Pseudogulbenkiania sp.]
MNSENASMAVRKNQPMRFVHGQSRALVLFVMNRMTALWPDGRSVKIAKAAAWRELLLFCTKMRAGGVAGWNANVCFERAVCAALPEDFSVSRGE